MSAATAPRPQHRVPRWDLLALPVIVLLVALVYRPVLHAGFVWDDILTFEQRAWLHHGDLWKQYVFTGFNEWTLYFRPLVVSLFVLQVRLFGGAPEPMHAVSLVMHLANVALVVFLARSLVQRDWRWRPHAVVFSGLAYGLHPMLVESVTWIGCQFDQVQVLGLLAGLLCARHIDRPWPRAVAVVVCFLVSAGAKESAATFPAIVFLFDWLHRGNPAAAPLARGMTLLRRHWPTYATLLVAGLFYLWLRRTMMGATIAGLEPWMLVPDAARIDGIAYVYLKYWSVVAGVPTELNPLHPVEAITFGQSVPVLMARVAGAMAILSLAALVFSRRFVATGVLVAAASLYLLPVLGIVPVRFDDSIYHERYAIGAIVLACTLLPAILHSLASIDVRLPLLRAAPALFGAIWLAMAIPNVRSTIPLWSDNVALWEWAVRGNPGDADALGNLASAYIRAGAPDRARALVQRTLEADLDCPNCYLNGFMLAVRDGDREMIDATIARLRDSSDLSSDPGFRFNYLRTIGHLELREDNPDAALRALRAALAIERNEPMTHLLLAEALVAVGDLEAARAAAATAVTLTAANRSAMTALPAERILSGEHVNAVAIPAATSRDPGIPAP